MMKKYLGQAMVLIAAAVSLTCPAAAEDTIAVTSGSRIFEDMPVLAPWRNTTNPAALSTFSIGSVSLAQAGYSMEKQDIRLFIQPEEITSFYAETKGYMQLGKLSFFGSFGYQNNRYNGVLYNSTLMFNTHNPYIVGDTVPDVQTKEGFDLTGQASLRLSNRIILAIGADYNAALGSKQKDPRNKNTIASLRITPGLIYDLGKFKVGINGSLFTSSNEISFSVEGNWKRDLFILQGLGYYKDEPEITSYSELYDGSGYSAGLQASYETGKIINIAEILFSHITEEARSGSSYRLIDGVASTNSVVFSDLLRIDSEAAYHIFTLRGSFLNLNGDEVLQRMYTVRKPDYSYDSLATISWIENKHLISDISVTAGYRYAALAGKNDIKGEIGGDITFGNYSSGHYPLQSYGEMGIMNLAISAFVNKRFSAGRNLRIIPAAELLYRMNIGSDLSYTEQEQSVPEMVYSDFDISSADLISGGVSIRIEKFLSAKTLGSIYFIPRFDYTIASVEGPETLSNYFFDAAIGLTF
jgi:hypothetical protein